MQRPIRENNAFLERFQAPQSPIEMITLTSTTISSKLFQVRLGGDVAAGLVCGRCSVMLPVPGSR